MRITKISVGASRKFNHPFEDFSNLGCHIQLEAEVNDADPRAVLRELQEQAESVIEDRKTRSLDECRAKHEREEAVETADQLLRDQISVRHRLAKVRAEEIPNAERKQELVAEIEARAAKNERLLAALYEKFPELEEQVGRLRRCRLCGQSAQAYDFHGWAEGDLCIKCHDRAEK